MILLLVVCLAAAPDTCLTVDPMAGQVSMVECQVRGQIALVEWLEEHPKWVGQKWLCQFGRKESKA